MFLRSKTGTLINADHIVRFCPVLEQGGSEVAKWIAITSDGAKLELDPFYAAASGRLEKVVGFDAGERGR